MIPIFDYNKLKGRITECYGTQKSFAEAVGRSDKYVSTVLNGKAFLGHQEIEAWVNALDISNDEIGLYFFTH